MNEVVWERRECVSAEVEDALVLLNLDTLLYQSLNRTATAIWELLAEPRSASEIVAGLRQRYEVAPDVCRDAVDRMLAQFQQSALISPRTSGAAVSSHD